MPLFITDSNNVFGMSVQEAGLYNVKVIKAQVTTTKGRGLQMLTLDVEVIDGKYKGGQIRFQNLVWDDEDQEHLETSVKRFNTLVMAVGVQDGVAIDSLNQIAQGIQNKQLSVDVAWGDPNNKGQVYLEIRGYHPVNPDGSQPNGVKRPNAGQVSPVNNQPQISNSFPNHSNDPFTNSKETIDVKDSDLPF